MMRRDTWPAVLALLCSNCIDVDLCPSGSVGRAEEDRCAAVGGDSGDEIDGHAHETRGDDRAAPDDAVDGDEPLDDEPVNDDDAGAAEPEDDDDPAASDAAAHQQGSYGDDEEPEPVGALDAGAQEASVDASVASVDTGADAADAGNDGARGRGTPGDGDGDGRCDIALIGARGMDGIPTALSNGDGTFRVVESVVADFPTWAAAAGVQPVSGDFDGDRRRDIALLGENGSSTISFAFSDGLSGSFRVDRCAAVEFATWAQVRGNRPVAGDFDGDGLSDIAMVGASGAWSIPVAFMREGCTIDVTNFDLADFPAWAAQPGAQAVSGDFDGDRYWDIALTGMAGAWTIPVAFSTGDGRFKVTNVDVGYFPNWAQVSGNRAVPGDFNGDGRGDIALTGAPGAWSIAVALSRGDGGFDVTNATLIDFPTWAALPAAQPVPGDFDHDGCGDIALVGAAGTTTIPVAFSQCDGSFRVTNATVEGFTSWAQQPGMSAVGGY